MIMPTCAGGSAQSPIELRDRVAGRFQRRRDLLVELRDAEIHRFRGLVVLNLAILSSATQR
jgi:hypothetical protein